jgi:hypothetical protein
MEQCSGVIADIVVVGVRDFLGGGNQAFLQ